GYAPEYERQRCGERRKKGHMGHLPSSSPAWTTACTRTRTIFGSLGSRARTSTGMKPVRNELRRGISFGFRVEKSIGAAATKKRVRCSMKNHLVNSTLCPRSRTTLRVG